MNLILSINRRALKISASNPSSPPAVLNPPSTAPQPAEPVLSIAQDGITFSWSEARAAGSFLGGAGWDAPAWVVADTSLRVNEPSPAEAQLAWAKVNRGTWNASSGAFPTGTITQYDYWTVANTTNPSTVGGVQFKNGDYLIAYKGSPSSTTFANNWKKGTVHGAAIDPMYADMKQPYDSRSASSAEGSAFDAQGEITSWPQSLSAGQILVKTVGAALGAAAPVSGGADQLFWRSGVVDYTGALFMLDSAPPSGAMAPSLVGWTGRTLEFVVPDLDGFLADIDLLDYSGIASSQLITWEKIQERIRCYPGNIFAVSGTSGDSWYDRFLPRHLGGITDSTGGTNYGQYLARTVSAIAHMVIGTKGPVGYQWTDAQKKEALLWLAYLGQHAWDAWAATGGRRTYGGGHFQAWWLPILVWLRLKGDDTALLPKAVIWEQANAFLMSRERRAKCVSHTDAPGLNSKSFAWRQRRITAVSGNDITVESSINTHGDPTKFHLEGMVLTRDSDNLQANVVGLAIGQSIDTTSGISGKKLTVVNNPGFAVGNIVHFETPYPRGIGEPDWLISILEHEITGGFKWYNPSYAAGYRNQQNSWPVLPAKAMGLIDDFAFAPVIQYVRACNAANTPAPGFDFPSIHGNYRTKADLTTRNVETEAWNAYATTVFDTVAPAVVSASGGVSSATITFSKNIHLWDGTIRLYKANAGSWTLVEKFDAVAVASVAPASAATTTPAGTGSATVSGSVLTIKPSAGGMSGAYSLQFDSGVLLSTEGIIVPGVADHATVRWTV